MSATCVRQMLAALVLVFAVLFAVAPAQGDEDAANEKFEQAFTLYQEGMLPGAVRLFNEGLALNADNATAHFLLAESYRKLGKFEDAGHHYKTSLELAPNGEHANRARALLIGVEEEIKAQQPSEAEESPQQATAFFSEGFGLLKAKDYDKAIESFEAGLKLDPSDAKAHFYLAEAYRASGDSEQAARHYRASLEANPDGDTAAAAEERLAALAASAGGSSTGDIEGARKTIAQALEEVEQITDPARRVFALRVIAEAQAKMGDRKASRATFAAAVAATNNVSDVSVSHPVPWTQVCLMRRA